MSQLSLFGDPNTPTKKIPEKRTRNRVGACQDCKRLLCLCGFANKSSHLARNNDPESSKRAAKKLEVVLSWRQTFAWSAVKMMCNPIAPNMVSSVIASGGRAIEIELGDKLYTANEIALFCLQELDPTATQDTIRRRLSELVEKRLCIRSSIEQFCRFSGQEVIGYGMNPDFEFNVRLRGEAKSKPLKVEKSK